MTAQQAYRLGYAFGVLAVETDPSPAIAAMYPIAALREAARKDPAILVKVQPMLHMTQHRALDAQLQWVWLTGYCAARTGGDEENKGCEIF